MSVMSADSAQAAAAPPDAAELAAWLRLDQTPGVGGQTARKLLGTFGLPDQIFAASVGMLAKVVPDRLAQALKAAPTAEFDALLARTLEWAAQPDNHVLTLADAAYPQALLDIVDPPLLLYAKGRIELLGATCLAVVGSRNATTQGMQNAEQFSLALSQAGLTIVSGMALGIDTAAHLGALRGAGPGSGSGSGSGSTIAVIGTGADIVYPARNRTLAHAIAADGCIVSEYALGTPAIAANFPRRNRIISGLARGVLVVEAAAQSGSLITARMAADQGRDVFAIPGSIHSPLSKGCHELIRQGAKLVESAQHVLEELGGRGMPSFGRAGPASAAPALITSAYEAAPGSPAEALLAALGHDPAGIDDLAGRAGLDMPSLQGLLLELEMAGAVEMLPGGQYRRLVLSSS